MASRRDGGGVAGRVFLGRYEVIRLLGEGGMGRAFLARDRTAGREVVVKVLHDDMAGKPSLREAFEQEMLFLARFRHPHVVALLDASVNDPQGPCLVMEYIAGVTLDQLRQCHRRLAPLRVGRMLAQLCLALHAAQALRIIHRDLKPANIMVAEPDGPAEKVKVMDFGLAKLASALYIPKERLANPQGYFSACGTPDYICPEQVRGDEVDHRSDLYSVGVILFELLTGRLPFLRPTIDKTLLAHSETRPPRFAEMGAAGLVPPAVEEVVQACLAKFPVERPQSARELVERYERALGERLVRPEEWRLPSAPPSAAPLSGVHLALRKPAEGYAVMRQLEAWMPERIAVVKLQGFVHDVGGEVVESVPGMIRVRLAADRSTTVTPPPSGLLARFGLGKKVEEPPGNRIEMELHMEKKDGGAQSRLQITVLLRPEGGRRQATDPAWRARCDELHRELRAYLIGCG
jgi:serine/threonine-protein kinase